MTDQTFIAAIWAVVIILAIVGVVRVVLRRRQPASGFGAGGTSTVPIGSLGVTKTDLSPSGVVLVVGEQWSAISHDETVIASGRRVRVVGQDGLTLRVAVDPGGQQAQS